MADHKPQNIDDIRVHLANDASEAILSLVSGAEGKSFAITQDMLMLMLGKLRDLNFAWEKRRREIDPHAGKAGDTMAMTAIKPQSVRTATVPGRDASAIIFETIHGPQAFLLPKEQLEQLGNRLIAEAARIVPGIRHHS